MTNTSTVTLGEFEFDPLEPTDFRLTVEGASNTGKSNTLAVILEDLAETHVPTLIIERLGILSPVRKLDEQLIVVGARDEQGIDLAVPLDQLDLVAEMVLERGLKVLPMASILPPSATTARYRSERGTRWFFPRKRTSSRSSTTLSKTRVQ